MQFNRPRIKRARVVVTDPDGQERSKSATVYNATPDQVLDLIKSAGAETSDQPRRRAKQPA